MEGTITVEQLNARAKALLAGSPDLNDVWVVGEISNCKMYPSGHYYFTLKDQKSEIRSVMFKFSRARISFEPKDSLKVVAFGSMDVYVERGSYQFKVETMRLSGVGDLYAAYERLKAKLQAEGLFDAARKRKLPVYPKVIGVVTSEAGAVIHDIITTSARRFPADILLCPAQVQGEGAAKSIVRGIEVLNREGADVIIVGRGGGSIEDLWAFNEEPVARAIAASAAPVISAVGHETDFTIADFVADVRAPTPTGAAEIALRDRADVLRQIGEMDRRAAKSLKSVTESMRSRFMILDSKLSPKRAEDRVGMLQMAVDSASSRLNAALTSSVSAMKGRFAVLNAKLSPKRAAEMHALCVQRLASASDSLDAASVRTIESLSRKLDGISGKLSGLDPTGVLGRGYSFVRDADGRTLTSVSQMREGSDIEVRMRDGAVKASVREVRYSDDTGRSG
jgi:exodeoxyribonuclease VII large subunit